MSHHTQLGLIVAFASLLVLTLQYPFSTTWPPGGDVTRYVTRAEQVHQWPSYVTHNSNYPGTTALLSLAGLLPFSWAEIFTWLTVIAYIFVGICLGWLVRCLGGWPTDAVTIFAWSLTVTGITPHIEDATLAQLLSLGFMLLAIIQFLRERHLYSLFFFVITTIVHPASALVLIPTFSLATLIMLATGRRKLLSHGSLWLAPALAVVVGALILSRNFVTASFTINGRSPEVISLLATHFAPFLILAPFGFLALYRSRAKHPLKFATITSFSIISTWLAFNTFLGIGLFDHRFSSYFIIAVIVLSSLVIPNLLKHALPNRLGTYAFLTFSGLALAIPAWQQNSIVYNFYESNSRYARVHNQEIAAFHWMRDNLPRRSRIATTTVNRHTEWIPILTPHSWAQISSDNLWYKSGATHAAILKHREETPQPIDEEDIVFENSAVIIYTISYD